jgi:hypothetical protein
MALAVGLRLIQWNLIDSLYRDTVNFIAVAERFSAESLKDPVQEPMHPLMLRGIHAVLFPREVPTPAINVSSWELTVFADGIFFTLICLWLLYAVGKYLHSPATGLWAAFFLAIIPYGVEYSINGLSELPYAAFLFLSVYLILRAKEKNGELLTLIAGACAALLILTRKEGVILIPIMVLYILCQRCINFSSKFKMSAFFLLGTGLLLGGYYLVGGRFYWLSDYVRLLTKLTHQIFSQQACTGDEQSIFAIYWIGKKYEFLTLPVGGFFKLSGFIPAILFVIYLIKHRALNVNYGINLLILYASLHFAMICVQTFLAKFLVTRYLFPVCMILFPIAGMMMVELLGRANLKFRKPANHHRSSLIAAIFLAFLFILEIIQNGLTSRHPETLSAARWLEANTPVNTLVFTTDDRIGFYSHRPWKNVGLYNVLYDVPTLPPHNSVTYVAASHKSDEKDRVALHMNQFPSLRNLQADLVRSFSNKNNQVTIYRLRAMPVTPPATEPAAQ